MASYGQSFGPTTSLADARGQATELSQHAIRLQIRPNTFTIVTKAVEQAFTNQRIHSPLDS